MLQILFIFLFPLALLILFKLKPKVSVLSPIIICYLVGIILANISFINMDHALSLSLAEISVPLAIPLILFSTDFLGWLKLAKKTLISFVVVMFSAIVSALVIALIFPDYFNEYWKVSGMLVGVYTGGTPNLMAIGMGLKVNEETLLLVNAADVVLGGIYFLFLILFSKRLLSKFLPAYEYIDITNKTDNNSVSEKKNNENPLPIFDAELLKSGSFALILSIIIVGISVGISMLIYGKIYEILVMLIITTLGIAASFFKGIRSLKGTYKMGQYFLLVFSLAIGTTVNIKTMTIASPKVFIYTALIMTTAIIIHYVISAFLKIDSDTVIITSTASIFGPAFVGPVAEAIKNREVVIAGFTCGLIGYAVGNYLGFMTAYIIKGLM